MTTTTKFQLDKQNYHSIEANQQYMSVSQFKEFDSCEAAALAKVKGNYVPPYSNSLLVGSYTHAAFESEEVFNQFIEENNGEIFNNRGNKYADFQKADEMIETIKSDPFCMFAMNGEKEVIFTGELFGAEWKIKVDNINHQQRFFSDLKTTQDLHKRYWSEKYNNWVSFVEAWDYVLQMAIYRRVIHENLGFTYTPYIVAVSKEIKPNKAVLHFDESRFDFEYEYLELKMERVMRVKAGDVIPTRCEKCDYCRATKRITDTMEIGMLIHA